MLQVSGGGTRVPDKDQRNFFEISWSGFKTFVVCNAASFDVHFGTKYTKQFGCMPLLLLNLNRFP